MSKYENSQEVRSEAAIL